MFTMAKAKTAIAQYLISLREDRALTQAGLAEKVGIGINTISAHENGHHFPPPSIRRLYAKAYGFESVEEFDAGWRGQKRTLVKGERSGMIPVINKAPAGSPMQYDECFTDSGQGFEYIDRTPGLGDGSLFAFVVVGDSMIPEFHEGDYVVCDWSKMNEIDDGEAVFVRFSQEKGGACTFKRIYRIGNDRVELRPDNARHQRLVVQTLDIVRIAPVVEVRRKLRRDHGRRIIQD